MAVEILGGPLVFSARIDTDQLAKDAEKITAITDKLIRDSLKAASQVSTERDSKLAAQLSAFGKEREEHITKTIALQQELNRLQQAQANITAQRDAGKLSAENASTMLAALTKIEGELLAKLASINAANDKAISSFGKQQVAVEALGEDLDRVTQDLYNYRSAVDELSTVKQAKVTITSQRATGQISTDAADSALAALERKEEALLMVVENLGRVNAGVTTSFEKQQAAVAGVGASYDQSTQHAKEYLATVEELNKRQTNTSPGKPSGGAPPPPPPVDDTLLNKSLATLAALDDVSQQFIYKLIKTKAELKEVADAQTRITGEYKKGALSLEEYEGVMTALAAQEKSVKESLSQLVEKQAQYDKISNANIGFLNQKKALLAALQKEYAGLNEADLKDAQVGGELRKSIAGLQQEVNAFSFKVVNEGAEKTVSLMAQLRQKKQELANTPITDPGYGKLFQEASELKDKIGDINDAVKLASSDTSGFDAMAQGLRGIAAGFAALEGASALFTDDQAKIQKATKDVTAAMTILQGVQEITALLDKNSALNVYLLSQYRKLTATNTAAQAVATEGLAVAEVAQATATEGATVAQEGLNVAMSANPAGILLLAITAVISAITLFSSSTEDAKEKQKAMNDALDEADNLLKQLAYGYSTIDAAATQKAENAVALAQAQGKSEKEILALKTQALKTKKAENDAILQRLGMDKQHLQDQQNIANSANEELKAFQDLIAAGVELDKVQKDRLETVKANAKQAQTKIDTATPLIQDNDNIQLQLAEEAAAAQKKAREDSLKSAAALAEARLLLAKKNTAAEYAASVDAIKARTRVELADVNLTSGERAKALAQQNRDLQEAAEKYHTLQLSNEKATILAKLDVVKKGSAEELKLRLDLINQNAAIELAQSGVTEERKKQIKADATKAIADETKKANYDATAAEINAILSSTNARLSAIQAGTGEELALKKELVEQKAILDIASAKNQIDNEKQLAAKIEEITAKSLEDRRKLEDDFVQHVLDNRTKQIQYENDLRNVSLDAVTGSSRSSEKDKAAAQLQILINNRDALIRQMSEVENAIGETTGDHNKLLEKRRELWLQILAIINQINGVTQKTEDELNAKIVSDISKLAGVFNSIGDSISVMNEGLGTSLKFIGSMVSSLGNAQQSLNDFNKAKEQKDAIGQVAGIGGIVSSAVGIVGSIVGIFTKAAEARKKLLAEMQAFQGNVFAGEIQINELYRQRTLEQVRLNKLRLDGINAEMAALTASKPQIQADYDKVLSELQKQTAKVLTKNLAPTLNKEANDKLIQQLLDSGLTIDQINEKFKNFKDTLANISLKNLNYQQLEDLFLKGQLDDKAKSLFQQLQALKKEGLDVDKALADAKAKTQELFTGTTAQSLADSIREGLKNGYKSVADFAGNMEEMFRNAILSGFEAQVIEKQMQEFYDSFAEAAQSNGGLDKGEIDALKNLYETKLQDILNRFQQLKSVTGQGFGASNQSNSFAGQIKGITETTAELIAGQFGAMRVNLADQLEVSKRSLDVQLRIEANTAAAIIRLDRANQFWQDVTTGVKKIHFV